MRAAAIVILTMVYVAELIAGGPCRTFRSFRQVAAVQPNAYYQVQQQKAVPFLYSGDVDAFLKIQSEIHRLEQGLASGQVSHEQKMLAVQQSLYQIRALQSQQMRAQALKDCSNGAPGAPPAEALPGANVGNLDAKVMAIFTARKCTTCHGGKADGGFQIASGGRLTQDARELDWCILGRVASGNMPKEPHEPLTDEEIQTVAEWASSQ